MDENGLYSIIETEYPRLLRRLKGYNPEIVRPILHTLSLAPAPTGSLCELYYAEREVIEEIFQWNPESYRISINRRGDIIIELGSMERTDILIDLVPHGDQVSFYPVAKFNGVRYEGEGKEHLRDGWNHVQVFPSHKCMLGQEDGNEKTRVGREFYAVCYKYDPYSRNGSPGLREITRGVIKCVRKIERRTEDEPLRDSDKSPYIFEYEGNIRIPNEVLIIYDNEAYYCDDGDRNVEAANVDDRAGLTAALIAADMLISELEQRGRKIRIVTSSEEEGPPEEGPYGWAEGAFYPIIRDLAKGDTPPTDAIVIDGHRAYIGSETYPGNGALYGLRSGGGRGARCSQNIAELLSLNSRFLGKLGVEFRLNKERFSRSSEVWIKFMQNPLLFGFPIEDIHLPPERCNLDDIVALSKAIALYSSEMFIKQILKEYVQPYG